MFLDASAAVSIIVREPDWRELALKLKNATRPILSPMTVYETALAISRVMGIEAGKSQRLVGQFVTDNTGEIVPITAIIGNEAIVAFARFGKGNHPAKLNMGDCFAYACARVHNVPLLCKGDDFIHTDIRIA